MPVVKEDCIFCKIANGQIPSNSIYEDEDFNVILDVSPASKGHALILPKKHFDNAYHMDEDVAKKVGVAIQTIYKYENEIVTNIPLNKLEKIDSSFVIEDVPTSNMRLSRLKHR